MRLLVTGGAGFIGSHLVEHLIQRHPDWSLTVLDALTYAGSPQNLAAVRNSDRLRLIEGRIEDEVCVRDAMAGVQTVARLAAETHVDRSIADPAPFLTTNVLGTQVLLDAARRARVTKFLHVSTDEVYGSLGEEGRFTEESPLDPRSPYAASKAAGDQLARAYFHTYALPVVVVRPSNTYGPRQYLEKFLPVLITNALEGRPLPVYGKGRNVRDWLWVHDLCRGLEAGLLRAVPGEVLNLGGNQERENLGVARLVLELVGRPPELLTFVEDRPGHDFRYALDSSRARDRLGWVPEVAFEEGLARLIAWYRENESWWQDRKQLVEASSRGFWTEPVAGR
ncbi:MAG: dTDP-glucose 4,6-dehydratase [Gemmatimonadota bacterium]